MPNRYLSLVVEYTISDGTRVCEALGVPMVVNVSRYTDPVLFYTVYQTEADGTSTALEDFNALWDAINFLNSGD